MYIQLKSHTGLGGDHGASHYSWSCATNLYRIQELAHKIQYNTLYILWHGPRLRGAHKRIHCPQKKKPYPSTSYVSRTRRRDIRALPTCWIGFIPPSSTNPRWDSSISPFILSSALLDRSAFRFHGAQAAGINCARDVVSVYKFSFLTELALVRIQLVALCI